MPMNKEALEYKDRLENSDTEPCWKQSDEKENIESLFPGFSF